MFNKVLIANRGAIATRIIRTLRRLGVTSVAVYAQSDAHSLHVSQADEAYCLGEGGAADTYLDASKLIAIARQCGAEAIHPGYGFLSENADFVRRCEQAGIAFVGPTPEQMEDFGLKHRARELAQQADVPMSPGSGLLQSLAQAQQAALDIGYPVMLKSTAGGGGIGMQLCQDSQQLEAAYASVKRLGANNFANDDVFLEKFIARARHIEVQVFGDGQGKALALGERDCSSQRRNQKVVEECPAPHLSDAVREELHRTAERLLAQVSYRNAGTVEFIYDADTDAFYFLEVNTRLQVEHGVTEQVYGVDLVEWMLRLASGEALALDDQRAALRPHGHAMQVRIYAEDPSRDFQPCAGLLSRVRFPEAEQLRIDHWLESGIEVPPYFDPMLAKVIVHGDDRTSALQRLQQTLAEIELYGIETNLGYLQALLADDTLQQGLVTTRYLNSFRWQPARIEVLQGGTQTTVQDYPGRSGHWDVGVPPSGPFDSLSFRLANRLLGNAADAAGLEITLQGPTLKFTTATRMVIGGAAITASLDGSTVPMWQVLEVAAGQQLQLGRISDAGARAYLAVAGGIQCPAYLGSRSTFTLGQFGGHNGRALRTGDTLALPSAVPQAALSGACLPAALLPAMGRDWQLRVIYGPHGAPDFFTAADIDSFFSTDWEVHYNSSRTGVRLIGPKPQWARPDGGEAGMHPSNIHDNAYAWGTVDFTGDMPVILGPDGPSLGGFVCPATVIQADLWKLGQLRAGDRLRFVPVSLDSAVALERQQLQSLATLEAQPGSDSDGQPCPPVSPIMQTLPASQYGEEVVYRAAGDHFLLVEYGPLQLDIRLRFRAHALMQWLQAHPLPGLRELTPGIRSLQVHYDSQQLSRQQLLAHLQLAEQTLASQLDALTVPSRIVYLPLSWNDAACQQAIEKYMQSVRANAPWCPSNLEFIRRINGLDSIEEVKRIVFEASYLVMGLGDVYLGAPVATPVDPRHRLVTTKYNPARTWTAENSVGIGGSYLCVYGMEGPGGYQFVGRTLQMWNRYRQTREFARPWLLRFFDQIRFYEVSADELLRIREDFPRGNYPLRIEEGQFSLASYQTFIDEQQPSITRFTRQREAAFAEELQRWHASGQFNYEAESVEAETEQASWPEHATVVDSPVSGSVWQADVAVGDKVTLGQPLLILESMKMEIPVFATCAGTVTQLLVKPAGRVNAGQVLVVIE
ncbi:urea carboxylase [Pokkaliibacter plantistimulans]|uniref:Urea carboxylase n=1 Tax=Proteobacteria bacterium 228 TaxID=2083153 RepID=A0A2S5KK06_9PROT|nr:urea carboxylase [Pokkaliibacter plantistimulans]PPC75164.1 urea carboxylase [Pokkaliibacter plantistimulans]